MALHRCDSVDGGLIRLVLSRLGDCLFRLGVRRCLWGWRLLLLTFPRLCGLI